jgi:hypothetical protein
VAGSGGADLMIRFRLERRGDGTNHYQKMKRRQQAHFDFIARKCDTVWRRRLEERWHRGGEREGTTPIGLTRMLLDRKIKKIHMVDSFAINGRGRFKAMMS